MIYLTTVSNTIGSPGAEKCSQTVMVAPPCLHFLCIICEQTAY